MPKFDTGEMDAFRKSVEVVVSIMRAISDRPIRAMLLTAQCCCP
ncbi:MAG: hypothetical protein QMD46_01910 [Methanomicrobiales archaeon]|nr:hypothetical protein [Methanomicrobiales archaeon]MDI6875196.1 hypothetical protein [Methanomicrobiales archaeon]